MTVASLCPSVIIILVTVFLIFKMLKSHELTRTHTMYTSILCKKRTFIFVRLVTFLCNTSTLMPCMQHDPQGP